MKKEPPNLYRLEGQVLKIIEKARQNRREQKLWYRLTHTETVYKLWQKLMKLVGGFRLWNAVKPKNEKRKSKKTPN